MPIIFEQTKLRRLFCETTFGKSVRQKSSSLNYSTDFTEGLSITTGANLSLSCYRVIPSGQLILNYSNESCAVLSSLNCIAYLSHHQVPVNSLIEITMKTIFKK